VLKGRGFEIARETGERQYTKAGHPRTVTVPRNRKEITPGTLSSIWRQAGMTKKEAEELR